MTPIQRFNELLHQDELSLDETNEFISLLDELDEQGNGAGLLAAFAGEADPTL